LCWNRYVQSIHDGIFQIALRANRIFFLSKPILVHSGIAPAVWQYRSNYQPVRLRLDANGGWDRATAAAWVDANTLAVLALPAEEGGEETPPSTLAMVSRDGLVRRTIELPLEVNPNERMLASLAAAPDGSVAIALAILLKLISISSP